MRQVGGVRDTVWSRPTPLSWWPTNRRSMTIVEVLPKEWGVQVPIRFPILGVLHWEDKLPECLDLKTSRAYVWASQRVIGNRDSALKGHMQNLVLSKSQHRGSSLKGACVRPTCWSRRQEGLPLGMEMLVAAMFESSFYHKNTHSGKHHFRILSLDYWPWGPSPTFQKAGTSSMPPPCPRHTANRAGSLPLSPAGLQPLHRAQPHNQPNPRPALPTSTPRAVSPPQQKGTCSPQRGHP